MYAYCCLITLTLVTIWMTTAVTAEDGFTAASKEDMARAEDAREIAVKCRHQDNCGNFKVVKSLHGTFGIITSILSQLWMFISTVGAIAGYCVFVDYIGRHPRMAN